MPNESAKTCVYVADFDDTTETEIVCGDPAEFECCGEYYCSQHAHDWLDELQPPGFVHEVSALNLVKESVG